jgi:hypothetical protein
MLEVKITHLDRVKLAIHSRSYSIICDQPEENEGEDTGMPPPRTTACIFGLMRGLLRRAVTEGAILRRRRGSTSNCGQAEAAYPFGKLRILVTCSISLTEDLTDGLMRSVHHCLVHNTLLMPPEIKIEPALDKPVFGIAARAGRQFESEPNRTVNIVQ